MNIVGHLSPSPIARETIASVRGAIAPNASIPEKKIGDLNRNDIGDGKKQSANGSHPNDNIPTATRVEHSSEAHASGIFPSQVCGLDRVFDVGRHRSYSINPGLNQPHSTHDFEQSAMVGWSVHNTPG